jgi:hypothetical protein
MEESVVADREATTPDEILAAALAREEEARDLYTAWPTMPKSTLSENFWRNLKMRNRGTFT